MNIVKYIQYTFLGLLLLSANLTAQEECAFTLREAEKLYQQGEIEKIPSMLSACIQNGFTREERLQAYKLIIMTYLFNDDIQKSDSAMFAFLKKYPDYDLSPTDNNKFSMLYSTYKTNPVFSFGLTGGTNVTVNRVKESLSTGNLNAGTPDYSTQFGYQIGLRLKFDISEEFSLLTDFQLQENGYTRIFEKTSIESGDVQKETLVEKSTNFYFPISIAHNFEPWAKLFTPSVKAGFGLSYRLLTEITNTVTYTNPIGEQSNSPDFNSLYKPLNYWANIGGQVKFEFLRGYIIVDLTYHHSLIAQLETPLNAGSSNPTMIMPDKLKQGIFTFSFGYIYSVYKPRKIKW